MSYIVGGVIPLSPYLVTHSVLLALWYSVAITAVALAAFGAIKGRFLDIPPLRGALQTIVTGGLAATVPFCRPAN